MSESTWASEQLVAAAVEGDAGSIAALVSGSYPHVRRFARTLCASPEDAEDAAQEALIVLYRKIGTLRATGALAAWMFRIVRHECLRRAKLLRAPLQVAQAPATRSAEDDALGRWEAERIAAAIATLPTDQRQVLIMRDIQGLGGRVVADALGLSLAAMKSRLHRARAAVRGCLPEISERDMP
ncbi:RNA polymerase sigma factor [Nocardia panacis]|uniref:RNA polymerase sigma factor n=1 Tax=Nocardia panacis TaxID=2340916 RepID=A0A3A4K3E1_9NOCA|nr:RNA polymerase sigma factor [Nocardia panacis]RJO79373.1 RNA polymerase sigma factor [Nocardia panacis]